MVLRLASEFASAPRIYILRCLATLFLKLSPNLITQEPQTIGLFDMAVPKRKTSTSKRNMRRSHHALKKVCVVADSKTGELKLPHHVSLTDGYYNRRQIVASKG